MFGAMDRSSLSPAGNDADCDSVMRIVGALLAAPAALLLAVACGGGGGGENPFAPTDTPATVTEVAVYGGPTATPATTGGRRSPTPDNPNFTPTPYPSGPEGAVNLNTIGRKPSGSNEVYVPQDEEETVPIGPWVTPLLAWDAIGDKFGEDRGDGLVHGGIDFRVDSTPGVDVYAVCDGFVAGIEYSETHGQYIVLKCPDKWTAVYGFMEIIDVKVNDPVVKGQTILGAVGNFLHFELRWDFKPVDPEQQLQFHVRPGGLILTPTPTPSATPEPTDIPEDTPTPPPTSSGGNGGGGGGADPTATPVKTPTPSGPPTSTPTPTITPTVTPTPTPTPKPPTPSPTPLPQAF